MSKVEKTKQCWKKWCWKEIEKSLSRLAIQYKDSRITKLELKLGEEKNVREESEKARRDEFELDIK